MDYCIPCAECGSVIKTRSMRKWYCEECLKRRQKNQKKTKRINGGILKCPNGLKS
jgi:hypothetical protein